MTPPLDRVQLLPEPELPESRALIAEGRKLAASHGVGEGRKGPAPSTREAVLPRILKGH